AAGRLEASWQVASRLKRLSGWWDRFATTTVSDVRHVVGKEAAVSAEHVAGALSRWRQRGETAADLAFWQQQLQGFNSCKSFALVVDALLRKDDLRAPIGFLVPCLSPPA